MKDFSIRKETKIKGFKCNGQQNLRQFLKLLKIIATYKPQSYTNYFIANFKQ